MRCGRSGHFAGNRADWARVGAAGGVLGEWGETHERDWRARLRGVGPVLLVVVVVVTAIVGLETSGGTLAAGDGAIWGLGVHPAGTPVRQYLDLTARSARNVVLDHVSSEHSAGVDVHFSIAYTIDDSRSSVASIGRVAPVPVHGARVGDGSRGVAWLVVTVVPKRPGHWSITKLAISYHSWIRHRRTTTPGSAFRIEGTAT
jgi:hypothetical protein